MSFLSSLSVLIFQGYFCIVAYGSCYIIFPFLWRGQGNPLSWEMAFSCMYCMMCCTFRSFRTFSSTVGHNAAFHGTCCTFCKCPVFLNSLLLTQCCRWLLPSCLFYGFYYICVVMGANKLAPLHFGCVTTSFYFLRLLLILYFLSVFAYILLSLLSLISILHQVVCSCETASFINSNSWVTYSIMYTWSWSKKGFFIPRQVLRKTMACLHFPYLS